MYDIILRKIVAKTADKLKNTFNSKNHLFVTFFIIKKFIEGQNSFASSKKINQKEELQKIAA